MNVTDPKSLSQENPENNGAERTHRYGKVVGGLMVVIAGLLFLANEINIPVPAWVFTWQMLIISFGFFIGVKHGFRGMFWLILIAVGVVFLMRDWYPDLKYSNLIWPVTLIIIGLFIVFKPRKKNWKECNREHFKRYNREDYSPSQVTSNDFVEINAIFGGVERVIVSKNFKGGEINSVFGGSEINLTQAELTERAELEINAVFGGVRLIIPPNWGLQSSELTAVMGSVEDKRPIAKDGIKEFEKTLVLKGHAVFGGIEIQSY